MSLFKLLSLWSFSLNELEEPVQYEDSDENLANFIVCPGTFKAIGCHAVLVCGSSSGLLCIVQVPEGQLNQSPSVIGGRQLLAVRKVDEPIIDLKCGFFSSSLKQSIAVLSFEELTIYQVKKNQTDLLSDTTVNESQGFLQQNFSHDLEEVYKFRLPSNEMAIRIEVSPKDSFVRLQSAGEQIVNQRKDSIQSSSLTLPQRDYIVIQYTNQFLFTLINHKKIIAHYELRYPTPTKDPIDNQSKQVQQLSCFLGPQAMAIMHDSSSDNLLFAMSNLYLYNFDLSKLIALSKDRVMKKIVDNLLSTSTGTDGESQVDQRSSLVYNNITPTAAIEVNLDEHSDWQLELLSAPLQMHSINLEHPSSSRLVVLSRYLVDVYSKSGEHIWSHRSETPLICMNCYPVNDTASSKQSKLVILVCSDIMLDQRCNLLVFEDGMKVWSSLMYQKPSHIWRINLMNIAGAIVTYSIPDSLLNFGYLGTNSGDQEEYFDENLEETNSTQLELLAKNSFNEDNRQKSNKTHPRLQLNISLQASNKWPEVRVNTKIVIKPDSNSHGVYQNIVISLEYDDLLNFTPDAELVTRSSKINEGAVQVELGTYCTDSPNPLLLSGTFSLKPVISFKSDHALPKSLEVKITVKLSLHQREIVVHQDTFLLPLTFMANLIYIDHSCEDRELFDYERNTQDFLVFQENSKYLSLITTNIEGDLIEFIDKLIESDLICRRFNLESDANQLRTIKLKSENYASTLENLKLLNQSLDCRIKYKSLGCSTPIPIHTQKNEGYFSKDNQKDPQHYAAPSGVHIGFELQRTCMFPDLLSKSEADDNEDYSTVWLNLYSSSGVNSELYSDLLKKHLKKIGYGQELYEKFINRKDTIVMISIESQHPLALLLVQQHLLGRLRLCKKVESNASHKSRLLDKDGQVVWNSSLCDFIRKLVQERDLKIRDQFIQLKEKLNLYFYKFQLTSIAILSHSKRLPDLPEHVSYHFDTLVALNKKYQLHLTEVLSNLESLRKLDKQFSKVPDLDQTDGDIKLLETIRFSPLTD